MTGANWCVDNRDVICYLVTKHSWKGKYKRVFSIGTMAITTYNPQTLEITNQWEYTDFNAIRPSPKNANSGGKDEFVIHTQKGKKDAMRFSSEHTADIITDVLMQFPAAADEREGLQFSAYKQSWQDSRRPVVLRLGAGALEQVDNRGVVLARYPYTRIRNLGRLSDCLGGGFVIDVGEQRRRHIFACAKTEELLKAVRDIAARNIGIAVPLGKEQLTLDEAMRTRLGLCSRDECITSYMERDVQKLTVRHDQPVHRLLCLSESCLIERDPSSYAVICATPLKLIVCIVRILKDPQQFVVEYDSCEPTQYAAADRDLIIASLLDGARASGNAQVFVTGHRFDRALRLIPFTQTLDEEGESQCMRHIIAPPPGLKRADLIRRFNANVPYNGLTYSKVEERFLGENKERVIVSCLEAVLAENYGKDDPSGIHKVEQQLQCLRRLFASKSGFNSFTEVPGIREKLGPLVARVLQWKCAEIDHAVIEMLCALMHPMHDKYQLRNEQLNKASLLSSPPFVEALLDLLANHVDRNTGWLVVASMLDFLTYSVCAPYSETTAGETFDMILKMVATRGRSFYALFQAKSMTIVKGAGMVMRAIIEESDVETSKAMQTLALTEGAFLSHLEMALLATGRDLRVQTNRQLSGHLIGLWIADNTPANDLLARCMPRGLLDFLLSTEKVPVAEVDLLIPRNNLEAATNEEKDKGVLKEQLHQLRVTTEAGLQRFVQNWDLEHKLNFTMPKREEEKATARPVVLRKRRQRIKGEVNWKLFAYHFGRDHAKADLIWNEKTRDEFKHGIVTELRTLEQEKEQTLATFPISWNHTEFMVIYPSLDNEIKIGDYYLRLLLAEGENDATHIQNPTEFFNAVYHRFLLTSKVDLRCVCLSAMAIAYERSHMTIGAVGDAKHFVEMLRKCTAPAERDRLVLLLSKLALNKENARELINADLAPQLVDLAVLAHLHVQRAKIQNQTNVIEASSEQMAEGASAAEWYYKEKDAKDSKDTQKGPLSFDQMKELYTSKAIFERTFIWASGMNTWALLHTVPQFRWTVCAAQQTPEGAAGTSSETSSQPSSLYNFTQLANVCLDILIQLASFFPSRDTNECVVRPMPKIKKALTDPSLLYQVVQLLLTYEAGIVQRVAVLLFSVMQDNPFLPRLYLSGVFFFILMYNGSNVLPIARFLHYTHLKQAFRSAIPRFEGQSQSVLAPLLPEAATFYLEHYGPEKYAEVFLGEFDNPEIIWNSAMRRHLIGRISMHLDDFTGRLTSNIKALYSYCPIPLIDYPELNNELFCHVYYLRHLCDRVRFPTWEIRDPVTFLRSCLAAWHEEIEKKPPSMSVEQATEVLGLNTDVEGWRESSVVRRAYFKLAAKYHPDKNPEGREMFERINNAYELLTSGVGAGGAPDPKRIVLCLRAQSIVYNRHSEELSEYKYAGYGRLIKTIDMEAKDANLFQKGGGELLSSAIELANCTLMSSALNAEQLRREQGLEVLQTAFDRCVPMVTAHSAPDELAVQVCEHVCNCFGTAARFEACRQRIAEMPTVFGNLCRLLQFPLLTRLGSAAASCVCSLAVCTLLQTQLFQAGVLWQLIPRLFHYDYTLEEGGVSHSEETNKQTMANKLARRSCEALACLAGFREETPENDGVQNSLKSLLTPYVCKTMRTADNDAVLKLLNSNTESPYMIWDNATRAELLEFVERHRTSNEQTSELFGAEFRLTPYAKELIVGELFIRIYNDQPDFPLTDPKSNAVDLLDYVAKYADELTGAHNRKKKANGGSSGDSPLIEIDWKASSGGSAISTDEKVRMTMTALGHIITTNPGIEMLLIGHTQMLVSYLSARFHPQLQFAALKVLSLAATNRECVHDLATVRACSAIFVLTVEREDAVAPSLRALVALAANGTIVKEMLEYGGLLYILRILMLRATDNSHPLRLSAAELLAKLQADKLTGPRWTRFLHKFLPPIFADAFRDPDLALQMFDGSSENPELIWNDSTRATARGVVEKAAREMADKHKQDLDAKWDESQMASQNWCAYGDSVNGELIVGGTFIRLFVANPGWTLRQPRVFALELINRILESMRAKADTVEGGNLSILTTAFVELARHHPGVPDKIPGSGYLHQFCTAMSASSPGAARSALFILEQLSENQHCANELAKLPCLEGIKRCMQSQPTLIAEAAHALKCLFKRNTGELAAQLLSTGLIPFLLDVLGGKVDGANSPAARAEIADALKSACLDLERGQQISAMLEKSSVWAQFKDQRHDLFLPASRTQAIAGGGSSQVAGYLTQSTFNPLTINNVPPPMD